MSSQLFLKVTEAADKDKRFNETPENAIGIKNSLIKAGNNFWNLVTNVVTSYSTDKITQQQVDLLWNHKILDLNIACFSGVKTCSTSDYVSKNNLLMILKLHLSRSTRINQNIIF